jgi:hypothetical protein
MLKEVGPASFCLSLEALLLDRYNYNCTSKVGLGSLPKIRRIFAVQGLISYFEVTNMVINYASLENLDHEEQEGEEPPSILRIVANGGHGRPTLSTMRNSATYHCNNLRQNVRACQIKKISVEF